MFRPPQSRSAASLYKVEPAMQFSFQHLAHTIIYILRTITTFPTFILLLLLLLLLNINSILMNHVHMTGSLVLFLPNSDNNKIYLTFKELEG